jgi:group II intron reverse transcriptase/maturase
MNADGKSDSPIVPGKPANKADGAPSAAEPVEERGLAKGNPGEQTRDRTQRRMVLQQALSRVRQAARKDAGARFTTLWHHVYKIDQLREAFDSLKPTSAPGIDGETWHHYEKNLGKNLEDLSQRLKRGAYRAKPVRRVYIPKADGSKRPLGIPVLEDKIVQRATVEVLNEIYEEDFLGFSYGYRPGRSQHNALDAVTVAIEQRKVSWVLDADIRGFFDTIDHEWLVKFVEHRIADQRVVRHVKKWLNAGVMEDGKRIRAQEGTPQGGNISSLLANIYLHYVFDLWVHAWRQKRASGEVYVIRYADDIIVGFQRKNDAERFLEELRERFRRFNLELHPDKTRLLEFGRFAAGDRKKRGQGKPETFDFLGFTHACSQTRRGKFAVRRRTMRKKMRAKLQEIKQKLKRRMHEPIRKVGAWLSSVLKGHYNYYAVPRNSAAMNSFRYKIIRMWKQVLSRRSQKGRVNWRRMEGYIEKWLPTPRIKHPYPSQRLRVITRGKSPVR